MRGLLVQILQWWSHFVGNVCGERGEGEGVCGERGEGEGVCGERGEGRGGECVVRRVYW